MALPLLVYNLLLICHPVMSEKDSSPKHCEPFYEENISGNLSSTCVVNPSCDVIFPVGNFS